ncbi:MAG: zinc ribbon domain-containing protein [Verrucomicrobiota bacterium]|jgi:putative FmdB family regulatory protein
MPTYDYSCKKCGRKFSLTMTMGEHEKKRVQCPKCHSKDVNQSMQPFFATTSKKS